MLTDKLQDFYRCVHSAMMEVGNSAPAIADRVIAEAFPETADAAEREGADKMLRDGVVAFLTKYLKRNSNVPMEGQGDFADISDQFRDIVGKLHSHSHYVPTLQQHMPVGFLIANPDFLDEARRFKRQKGEETLAEADALDELYDAVTERLI
jgi:hypothetical protein